MDNKFQSDVSHALGSLETGIAGINGRLDKLNGSVAKHEERLSKLESWFWRATGAAAVIIFILEKVKG